MRSAGEASNRSDKAKTVVVFLLLAQLAWTQLENKSTLSSFLPDTANINAKLSHNERSLSVDPTSNETTYLWIGNQWIPPVGTPVYRPPEMLAILQNHNVLWYGDSNCRQDMTTMYTMLLNHNATDLSTQNMDQRINLNKGVATFECTHRDFSNSSVRGILSTPSKFFCWDLANASSGRGKFDKAPAACPSEFLSVISLEHNASLTSMIKDYDVLVTDIGIWEIDRNWDCRASNQTESTLERIEKTLKALQSVSSPDLTVFWKTTGGSANHDAQKKQKLEEMNDFVRQWFIMQEQLTHMHLIDWAQQVRPRTYGPDRIAGDMSPHWGLPARTLTAQMLTHALQTTLG